MKTFSVTFRDCLTDVLYGGIVSADELMKLSNNTAIKICVVREIDA